MGTKFSAAKLKVQLNVASKRMQGKMNKLANQVKKDRRSISRLLAQGKDESARIQAEQIFSQIKQHRTMELLSMMCNLLHTRAAHLASEDYVPEDLVEVMASIIYCAKRVDVGELETISHMFASKFGEEWVKRHVHNQSQRVNAQILASTDLTPPEFAAVRGQLEGIAREFGVDWEPTFKEEEYDNENGDVYVMGSVVGVPQNRGSRSSSDKPVMYNGGELRGTLNIIIHESRRMHLTTMFGKQKLYVKARAASGKSSGKIVHRTGTVGAKETASWEDEAFPFNVDGPNELIMLEVWNEKLISDEFIGRAILKAATLVQNSNGRHKWYALRRGIKNDKDAGEICLSTQFMSRDGVVRQPSPVSEDNPSAGVVVGGVQPAPVQYVAGMAFQTDDYDSEPGAHPGVPPSHPSAAASAAAPMPAPAPAPAAVPDQPPPAYDDLEARFRRLQGQG